MNSILKIDSINEIMNRIIIKSIFNGERFQFDCNSNKIIYRQFLNLLYSMTNCKDSLNKLIQNINFNQK
jgi:hypothetical protein